ncbi:MAG TPA: FtsX-like permease family protein [Actinomycetota bacterium]|nr:FtsX-like permease family protein [Actinomycetota bacterium]
MLKATLAGLSAHKLRLALTALSVVLGVAFVAGSLVLTDTLEKLFTKLIQDVTSSTDVQVRGKQPFSGFGPRAKVPEALLRTVREVPGVQIADGTAAGYAQILGRDGKPLTSGGPSIGLSWSETPVSPLRLGSGRGPRAANEVVVDAQTFRDQKMKLGQSIDIVFSGPSERFTVVGTSRFGTSDNFGGARLTAFQLPTAQRLLGLPGFLESLEIAGDEGVSSKVLARRIRDRLPDGFEAITTDSLVKEQTEEIQEGLNFFGIALLVFAGVSLFVGSFIIFNTFSIIVAQRTREFGLLRALGASNRQIMRVVVAEALATGVVASVVGLGLGVLVAGALKSLLSAFGLDLPDSGTVLLPRTVIVALVVGIFVTLAASVLPARKAGRVPPMAALREDSPGDDDRTHGYRTELGAAVTTLGLAILALGLAGDVGNRPSVVGLGAVVVFIGVATASPTLAGPLSRWIAWPFVSVFKLTARLARENAGRSPKRTASTAAALMIGLALVSFVAVFASSIKASAFRVLDTSLGADFILTSRAADQSGRGVSSELAAALARRPELSAVAGMRFGPAAIGAKRVRVSSSDPAALAAVANLDVQQGTLEKLGPGEVFVTESWARANKRGLGDAITFRFARTGNQPLKVAGLFRQNGLLRDSDHLVSHATFDANFEFEGDSFILAGAARGVRPAAARTAITEELRPFPQVTVRDQVEFKREQEKELNRLLGLIYALLALAVVIALLGITNTLALSIFERTRELGLLRAIGMSRRQVRAMIRWEAVVIAVLGATLGLPIGVFFAAAMIAALPGDNVGGLTLPVGQLVTFVLLAGAAGVLAAIFPARRGARLNVLEAIAAE